MRPLEAMLLLTFIDPVWFKVWMGFFLKPLYDLNESVVLVDMKNTRYLN